MATRRVPPGPQRVAQHGPYDMNPLGRLGLAHPEQAPMEDLRGVLLEVDQDEQQPIFRSRQRTVLIGRVAAGLPLPPMQGPCTHGVSERRLKGGYQGGKLVHGHARQVSHLGRMGGKIAIPSHRLCLLSCRAPYNTNRDEL
jgi:hypothetical protein